MTGDLLFSIMSERKVTLLKGENMAKDAKERILAAALIRLRDREPGKTDGAPERIEAFSRHFTREYALNCTGGSNQ